MLKTTILKIYTKLWLKPHLNGQKSTRTVISTKCSNSIFWWFYQSNKYPHLTSETISKVCLMAKDAFSQPCQLRCRTPLHICTQHMINYAHSIMLSPHLFGLSFGWLPWQVIIIPHSAAKQKVPFNNPQTCQARADRPTDICNSSYKIFIQCAKF